MFFSDGGWAGGGVNLLRNVFCLSDSFEDLGIFCDFYLVLRGGVEFAYTRYTGSKLLIPGGKEFPKGCDSKMLFCRVNSSELRLNYTSTFSI